MKGKVKFYNRDKGFGFISADDGTEYFVHMSGFSEGLQNLRENDSVTFDVTEGDRGPKAVNVALDSGSEEATEEVEESTEEVSEE